jgi:hypothetical protein
MDDLVASLTFSLQYFHRRLPRVLAYSYHLEPQDEAARSDIRHCNSQSWILVRTAVPRKAPADRACSAILMGILKAVFMLTTGGDPDAIFDYWVHFWQK